MLSIFLLPCYSDNNISGINAEYCLAYDTTNTCGFFPSKWQIKISNLVRNVDFPNLNEEKALCTWVGTNIYAHIGNEKIELDHEGAICMHCGNKTSLKYSFSNINPWKCYSIHNFDLFNSLQNKNISIEWEKIGYCDNFKDTIVGKFDIKIKGKCDEKDVLWNAKYDIHKIPSPIDTLDIQEIPKENDTEYNRIKMLPYESFPITSELLERQKVRSEEYKKTKEK